MKAEEVFQRREEQRRGEAGKARGLIEHDNILNVRRPEFRKQACCVRSLWATENTGQVSSEHQNPKIIKSRVALCQTVLYDTAKPWQPP